MQCFLLPKRILKQIDKIYKDFFWNKLQSSRYQPLISWNNICVDKAFGGLGLHTAENTNISLHMRLLWIILMDLDNFRVRIIKGKYFKYSYIFLKKG